MKRPPLALVYHSRSRRWRSHQTMRTFRAETEAIIFVRKPTPEQREHFKAGLSEGGVVIDLYVALSPMLGGVLAARLER